MTFLSKEKSIIVSSNCESRWWGETSQNVFYRLHLLSFKSHLDMSTAKVALNAVDILLTASCGQVWKKGYEVKYDQ